MIAPTSVAAALADLDLEPLARGRLERYVAALLAKNATTNFTAARSAEAVAEHVRDSLALVPHVRESLVDIGSGGGFPALPLAIVTGYKVTLVESIAKKAAFLREVAADLGLSVTVVTGRAEDLGRDPAYRGRFASATARAVAGITTVLELAIPLLELGGVALLQRGAISPAERIAASDAVLVLGAEIDEEIAMPLATAAAGKTVHDGRRLLIVRKTLPTGPRFPRRAGIPAKRPLCVAYAGDPVDARDA